MQERAEEEKAEALERLTVMQAQLHNLTTAIAQHSAAYRALSETELALQRAAAHAGGEPAMPMMLIQNEVLLKGDLHCAV